jgi:WD40 repeat protein/ferric-dicitrate binding protein FerR (iron transport regulator)
MNRPNDAELLLAYLAGELPDAEAAALETRLKAEPSLAEQFLTLARDEAVLNEWARLTAGTSEPQPVEPPARVVPLRSRRWLGRRSAIIVALAASLLLAVGAFYYFRPSAGLPGPDAVVEDAQGEVVLVVDGEKTPVEKGQRLFIGAELRTVGEGSSAVVRYPDAGRLELSADTTARLEKGSPKTKTDAGSRRVYVPEGQLTAEVTQTPMVLATPHAEVLAGVGSFFCNIALGGTCVEPEKGRVRVKRKGQATVEVAAGFYAVADDASVSKPRLRPTPVTVPLAALTSGPGTLPCLVYTPDGRTLIGGANDGALHFWDVESRGLKNTIKAHIGAVRALALSPDGWTLATAGAGPDRFVRVWDVATGEEKYALRKRTEIECLALSPDGRTLAVGSPAGKEGVTLRLYDIATGVACGSLRAANPKDDVSAVAFSGDGRTLATGGRDGGIQLWDVTENPEWSALKGPGLDRYTLTERRALSGHALEVRALAFAPNGRLLASAGREGTARLWEVTEGEPLFHLTGHGREVRWVAFSRDGALLATAGNDGTARVWQTSDGQEYAIFRTKHAVARALFSPDGTTLATCGSDKSGTIIKLWRLQPPAVAARF